MRHLLFFVLQVVIIKSFAQQPSYKWFDQQLPAEERIDALIEELSIDEKISQLMDVSVAIDRLEIPEYNWWNECLHGVARNGRATVFPQAIGMAATFDTKLIGEVATAISDEARAKFILAQKNGHRARYAGLTFWSPNVNIFRDPRWGRGQETYGEDPFLSSQIGISFVKGLQGDHPKYLKAAACAKHYAVHSGPEALRHEFDAVVSNEDLYETYLPAFKALVTEAKVEAVMGAYNRVNGDPACASPMLLQEILRGKWGFEGHIVSDCGAIEDIYSYHKVVNTPEEAAAMAVNAGLDLNCGVTYKHLKKAVEQGLVTEEAINERLRAMLKTRIKLGLFDSKEDNPYSNIPESVVCSAKHDSLALETARKGIVLLSNKNNVLPLSPTIKSLYVTGPQANNSEVLLGNYYGMSNKLVNMLEGITAAVSVSTTINYTQGCLPYSNNVNPIDWTTGGAKASDAIIAVLGINGNVEGEEGEAIASETKGDRLHPYLPANQLDFLRKLRHGNTKPIIVVMTSGSPMIMPEVAELADAIVWAWYPGQSGGTAVADIIFGKVAPSGRLPLTFPNSIDQLPPYEDYSMKGRTYKYMKDAPLFCFGYGLSYTTFEYSNLQLPVAKVKKGTSIQVVCEVKNTGSISGDEVVQLYVEQPMAGQGAPLRKLVGFKRVHIPKGESVKVDFMVDSEQLTRANDKGEAIQDKGEYTFHVSGHAPVKQMFEANVSNVLSAKLTVK